MAGHCGGVRAYTLLLLLLVCLLGAASGLDFPHYHHGSTHSSTTNRYTRYDPEAAIAIDLGNTNSCVAGYTRGGPVETDTMFRVCIPSWVAFPDDGSVLVGEAAKNHADTHPEAAIFGFKRMLGLRYEEDTVERLVQRVPYKIGSTRYGIGPAIKLDAKDDGASAKELHVQQIATMVIDDLRKKAEDHLGIGTVRDALIIVPEHSNYALTQEARDAGRMAGLDVLGTVTEPVAAAVAYGLGDKLREDVSALVLHVGGGTTEASVVTLTDGGYFDVLAYRYDPFLGGDDFDRSVVNYFVDLIKIKHGKDVSQDRVALRKLGVACERAKKVLSSEHHAQVSIQSLFGEGMDFSESLSRSTFEKLNGDLFWKVIVMVHSAMADSELERGKIDEIILVAGSTMIPKIQRLVKVYFNGKEPNIRVKPDEAVAFGAAVKLHSLKYRGFESLDLL